MTIDTEFTARASPSLDSRSRHARHGSSHRGSPPFWRRFDDSDAVLADRLHSHASRVAAGAQTRSGLTPELVNFIGEEAASKWRSGR